MCTVYVIWIVVKQIMMHCIFCKFDKIRMEIWYIYCMIRMSLWTAIGGKKSNMEYCEIINDQGGAILVPVDFLVYHYPQITSRELLRYELTY